MSRKLVILTEGHTDPHTAKTASSVVRYRPEEVVALLDGEQRGKSCFDLLGVGEGVPIVATLAEAAEANTLMLGIAPPGGKIPMSWRAIIFEAISRGMDVIAGLHDFLSDDEAFVTAAKRHGVTLTDVRKNNEHDIARRIGIRDDCLRVLTVGHDCSVGKMVTSIEIANALRERGESTKFIATGQTGIMVEGDGCPIDRVIADFVSGAVEKMILRHQDHDILMIEGQGSLVHPSYSAVTLGLIHGCLPQAMILCYEVGRESVTGVEHVKIPPLSKVQELNEVMASITQPSRVIGISMNSRLVNDEQAEAERERVRAELGLPVCDVFRHGPDELVDAVLKFKAKI
jgi:D-glutamate N-acetyltransferase